MIIVPNENLLIYLGGNINLEVTYLILKKILLIRKVHLFIKTTQQAFSCVFGVEFIDLENDLLL